MKQTSGSKRKNAEALVSWGRLEEALLWVKWIDSKKDPKDAELGFRSIGILPERSPWRLSKTRSVQDLKQVSSANKDDPEGLYSVLVGKVLSDSATPGFLKTIKKKRKEQPVHILEMVDAIIRKEPSLQQFVAELSLAVLDVLQYVFEILETGNDAAYSEAIRKLESESPALAANKVRYPQNMLEVILKIGGERLLEETMAHLILVNKRLGQMQHVVFTQDTIYSVSGGDFKNVRKAPISEVSEIQIGKVINTHYNGEQVATFPAVWEVLLNWFNTDQLGSGELAGMQTNDDEADFAFFRKLGLKLTIVPDRETQSGRAFEQSHITYGVGIGYIE